MSSWRLIPFPAPDGAPQLSNVGAQTTEELAKVAKVKVKFGSGRSDTVGILSVPNPCENSDPKGHYFHTDLGLGSKRSTIPSLCSRTDFIYL